MGLDYAFLSVFVDKVLIMVLVSLLFCLFLFRSVYDIGKHI